MKNHQVDRASGIVLAVVVFVGVVANVALIAGAGCNAPCRWTCTGVDYFNGFGSHFVYDDNCLRLICNDNSNLEKQAGTIASQFALSNGTFLCPTNNDTGIDMGPGQILGGWTLSVCATQCFTETVERERESDNSPILASVK